MLCNKLGVGSTRLESNRRGPSMHNACRSVVAARLWFIGKGFIPEGWIPCPFVSSVHPVHRL